MNAVTRTMQRILADSPVSLREIARRCGVSHVQLARIVNGERNATPAVAAAVATALETLGADCTARAKRVRRSLATSGKGER